MTTPETQAVSTTSETTSVSTCGRVKWFNNRAGYGFITVSSGAHKGEDVFVHHSAIQVEKEQYRYLVQGEYVNFKLCEVNGEGHKWQAGEVSGVEGGQLMCETRLESRSTRTVSKDTDSARVRAPRDTSDGQYRVRSRGSGPREGDEWMLIRRRAPQNRSRPNTSGAESPTRETMRTRAPRGDYRVLDNSGEN